jgi:AhpD family alkylhydroperoxidase
MTATTTARHLAAPTPRLNFQAVAPELYKAQAGINALLHESSLGIQLLELVFLRVSQINGCAFCVDMHTRELLSRGEDLQRINSIVTWPEVTFYDDRERAALNWAERCTRLSQAHPEYKTRSSKFSTKPRGLTLYGLVCVRFGRVH